MLPARVAGNAGSMHLNKMEVNMNIDSRGNWMLVSYSYHINRKGNME